MLSVTVKPVLSDHIKQDIFLAFRNVDFYCCMNVAQKLLLESSTEIAFCATFMQQWQPPVYSDFHVTKIDGRLKQVYLYLLFRFQISMKPVYSSMLVRTVPD